MRACMREAKRIGDDELRCRLRVPCAAQAGYALSSMAVFPNLTTSRMLPAAVSAMVFTWVSSAGSHTTSNSSTSLLLPLHLNATDRADVGVFR